MPSPETALEIERRKHHIALLDAESKGYRDGEQRMVRVLAAHVCHQWRYVDALCKGPGTDLQTLEAYAAERALNALVDSLCEHYRKTDPSAHARMLFAILSGGHHPPLTPAARAELFGEIAGPYFAG